MATDSGREDLREALRQLLLPIDPKLEDSALDAAASELSRLGFGTADHAASVRLDSEKWADGEGITPELAGTIACALSAGDEEIGPRISESYLDLYSGLRADLFDHFSALAFLSHTRLVMVLATSQQMSAAQIARVLRARDRRVGFTWQSVQRILGQMGLRPVLDGDEVQAAHASDIQLEVIQFADASIETSAELLGRAGERLGFPGDLAELASDLYPDHESGFGPHLQMLHFVTVIAEFYDHALPFIYEFAPRGQVAEWLFGQYPPALTGAANPVLNNAKGVDQIDRTWSVTRNSKRESAHALASVIEGLDNMGFAARQELAGWIRRWLVRAIRLTEPLSVALPEQLEVDEIQKLLTFMANEETNTQGIIEQRVVDAVTSELFSGGGWRPRGLGDSVNATNLSRRKLGDCDFQEASSRQIHAWEAHAGKLTQVYLDGHVRTLRKSLLNRIEEMEGIAELTDWNVRVTFVGHSLEAQLPLRYVEEGVAIEIDFESYQGLFARAPVAEQLRGAIEMYVMQVLNQRRTPQYVRSKVLEIVG